METPATFNERRMKLIKDMTTYISEYESEQKEKIKQMKQVLKKVKSKLKLTQPGSSLKVSYPAVYLPEAHV